MPITKSAKKALRNSDRKKVFNIRRKKAIEQVVYDIKKLVKAKDGKGAAALLPKAYKAIDKAAKANTLDKNNASRRKSRLAAFIKKQK